MELLLIAIMISLPGLAHLYIMFNYKRYQNERVDSGLTGKEVAEKILSANNIDNVKVNMTFGYLSDHYDSYKKTVNLSKEVYSLNSVSAVSIAAHECGHALQDKDGYLFLRFRHAIYPIVRVATGISYWILFLGFLFELLDLMYIGIACTAFGLLFEIITLPVEFNASKRAIKELERLNIVIYQEKRGCSKVLRAAALTYVAGALSSAIQILRLVLIVYSRRD